MDLELVSRTAPEGLHQISLQQLDTSTSGVPQGNILGPLLFLMYINDLHNSIVSKISKLTDDTKLCHSSRHPDEVLELQEDILDELLEIKWQMNFNVDKCAVMHIGFIILYIILNNIQHTIMLYVATIIQLCCIQLCCITYNIRNQQLIATEEQRDLGITITEDLKWQKRTEKNCNTGNRVLGFVASNFNHKSTELMFPLYKSLVRPHLEYAVQFWSPHSRWDIWKNG